MYLWRAWLLMALCVPLAIGALFFPDVTVAESLRWFAGEGNAWMWQAPLAVALIAVGVQQGRKIPGRLREARAAKREADDLVRFANVIKDGYRP